MVRRAGVSDLTVDLNHAVGMSLKAEASGQSKRAMTGIPGRVSAGGTHCVVRTCQASREHCIPACLGGRSNSSGSPARRMDGGFDRLFHQ